MPASRLVGSSSWLAWAGCVWPGPWGFKTQINMIRDNQNKGCRLYMKFESRGTAESNSFAFFCLITVFQTLLSDKSMYNLKT